MRNLKLAARMLLKTPFVTAIAVLSLALGIGANSAIFSLYDQILLKKLPVPNPGELVNFAAPGVKNGSTSCNQAGDCDVVLSYPMFRDLARTQASFSGLAAHRLFGASVAINNEPAVAEAMMVSGSYFPTLQLRPFLGRYLGPADDAVIGANYVTVLGYDFWQDKFGSDRSVLGRTMIINGRTYTIVGVAPEGFLGTTMFSHPSLYVPISMRNALQQGFRVTEFDRRNNYWVYVFGRLKPGVSLEQADAAMNGLYQPIINDIEAPLQEGMSDPTMKRFREKRLLLTAGPQGQSSAPEEASTPLYLLLGVTGVVLLIACANIANLLLARGAGRAAEMGVRLALGANRRQLLTLLLTESVMLALLGGIASLLVAQWTLSFIAVLLPPDAGQSMSFALQPSVVVFAGALAITTGIIFGMFPALHSTRNDLITVIRSGAGQLTGGKAAARFRAGLVTLQITLSMALLVSAGLFLKSLVNVSRVDLGLKLDNVVTFAVSPGRAGFDTARSSVYFTRVEEELGSLSGVTGVASSLVPLLAGNNWGNSVKVQGYPDGPDVDNDSRYNAVGANYFTMLGVPFIAGRDISASDIKGGSKVAIVNETFAKKFNLGRDAVGKFMSQNDSLDTQIVGLITDAKYSDVKDTIPPVYYTPWRQESNITAMNFYVRTAVAPEQLIPTITAKMKELEPTVPVEEIKTMPQQIRENVFLDRMISILSAAFAVLATLLAGVGLYGVLAYTVAQRTREIGVRMALGASSRRVRGLVLKQVGAMTIIGGIIGIAAALGLGQAARSLLFGLEGYDALVFSMSILLLAVVALAAGYVPARRAAQVDPMQALRYD